jgi:hypothetical protein
MPRETALDSHRASRTVGGRGTPPPPIITLPGDRDPRHLLGKARPLSSEGLTLGSHEEAVEVLLNLVKVVKRIGAWTAAAQEVLQLIHGGRITGQETLTLQYWHGTLLWATGL